MPTQIVTPEIVGLLTYLLPGLVASATLYELTSYPKPGIFERIVQALIESGPSQGTSATPRNFNLRTTIAIPIAVSLALIATYVFNKDILHKGIRRMGITKETSHPSEWYSAFAREHPRYVVLHFRDMRRLYGWPEEWPSHSDHGHFRIADPKWLDEKNRFIESSAVDILISADQIGMVEFLQEHEIDEKG